jgi:endonuclease G
MKTKVFTISFLCFCFTFFSSSKDIVANGFSSISFNHEKYESDANSAFEVWSSNNSLTSCQQVGTAVTSHSTSLTKASFNLAISKPVRFQIPKTVYRNLNIKDSFLNDYKNFFTRDDNMAMGNPSNATTSPTNMNNFLMTKSQFSLSYNNSKGTPNWVSWHLSPAWKGSALRCNCFAIDNSLPSTFFKASKTSYSHTGFDRGHLCPSEDRDFRDADNTATFLMTNMIPQAPKLNRVTWVALENYCRTLISAGNELYIISGGNGSGGSGSNGGTTTKIASGKITVPTTCWKIIVVLPNGTNDVSRVSANTRIIAVIMPNTQTVNAFPWYNYRVSVDNLEALLGYDFLNNVSLNIQTAIESTVDNGPTH